jgi:cellulose synthase/poly-beta-1,6-N-acetylglucosamine synthase-like glycosyltransferase
MVCLTGAIADSTYAPETFKEFVKQRRRWILSELGNTLLLLRNGARLATANDVISYGYIGFLFMLFVGEED